MEDTSRVRDLSVGGLFVETNKMCPVNSTVELHFLVQDGEIKATANVQFAQSGNGLGLKFKNVPNKDQAKFAAMIKRLTHQHADANLTTGFGPKQSDK